MKLQELLMVIKDLTTGPPDPGATEAQAPPDWKRCEKCPFSKSISCTFFKTRSFAFFKTPNFSCDSQFLTSTAKETVSLARKISLLCRKLFLSRLRTVFTLMSAEVPPFYFLASKRGRSLEMDAHWRGTLIGEGHSLLEY